MAFLRVQLCMCLAVVLAAGTLEVSDEQSLVQQGFSSQAFAVEPATVSSPEESFDVYIALLQDFLRMWIPQAFESPPRLPLALHYAMDRMNNVTVKYSTRLATATLLSFRNKTHVDKVYATVSECGSILANATKELEKAGYDFATRTENASKGYSSHCLESNRAALIEVNAKATSDLIMVYKDFMNSQPTEFLQNHYAEVTEALKNVTREDVAMHIRNSFKNETAVIFQDEEHICKGMLSFANTLKYKAGVEARKIGQCEAHKVRLQAAAPYINNLAPDVTTEFMTAFNLTMDTMKNFSRGKARLMVYHELAMKDVLFKNLGCPAENTTARASTA